MPKRLVAPLPSMERCRRLRERAGFSQRAIAEVIGVAPSTLHQWETRSQPRGKLRAAYSDVLGDLARQPERINGRIEAHRRIRARRNSPTPELSLVQIARDKGLASWECPLCGWQYATALVRDGADEAFEEVIESHESWHLRVAANA